MASTFRLPDLNGGADRIRSTPRRAIRANVSLLSDGESEHVLRVRDLGRGGLFACGAMHVEVGQVIECLLIPDAAGPFRKVHLRGRVVRIELDRLQPSRSGMALQFIGLTLKQRGQLDRLLEQLDPRIQWQPGAEIAAQH